MLLAIKVEFCSDTQEFSNFTIINLFRRTLKTTLSHPNNLKKRTDKEDQDKEKEDAMADQHTAKTEHDSAA